MQPQAVHRQTVYLDHAAATPLAAEVEGAIVAAQAVAFANPSSQHAAGRAARRLLEDARERILHALGGRGGGVGRDRLVFTSGASEANHLAITGMAAGLAATGTAAGVSAIGTVLFSRRDHASAVNAVHAVGRRGWRVVELPLDRTGRVEPSAVAVRLPEAVASGPTLVSATLVCGQTGSVDATCLEAYAAALVHVDATQAAGLVPLDFAASRAATVSLAPHKFGGPRGIGALLIRGGVPLEPVLPGPQEHGLRGGTEAVPLAVGFARAVELAAGEREVAARRVAALRDHFERRVFDCAREAGIRATVVAADGPRCPQISTIAFAGLDRQALAMAADLAGVCLATGTACASGSSEPAPALLAMGLPDEIVRGAVRFSLGRTTTAAEADLAVARLAPLLRRP
jgi:cysteine desulfurase